MMDDSAYSREGLGLDAPTRPLAVPSCGGRASLPPRAPSPAPLGRPSCTRSTGSSTEAYGAAAACCNDDGDLR